MGDEKLIALLLMQQIAVLFLIMGLGFLIVKLGIVKTEDSRVLSMVTIYLVLPCVTIHAFQIEYSTKIRNGFLLAVAVAILIHVVLFVVCGILRKLLKMDEVETASLIYSNAGNLILPLVISLPVVIAFERGQLKKHAHAVAVAQAQAKAQAQPHSADPPIA